MDPQRRPEDIKRRSVRRYVLRVRKKRKRYVLKRKRYVLKKKDIRSEIIKKSVNERGTREK